MLPVATTLGLLADLEGDHDAAARYHRQGIALAERVQSEVLAARCRALAGHGTTPAAEPRRATIARAGDQWGFSTPFGTVDGRGVARARSS